ncbi:methyl-accepting chemotaxis protein [uncultured Pseudoteredinibacter sp.]|uniref:methyl-accepting chemotaxis protein n=1 Tax=uncultured Pseudoteredinibacter sp. TaxID=1641701 RepID=UPI0026225DD7|nr:methyl-accepting chemotaxis protein [uncultured Pseudoteredinibacter sp.]
MNFFNSMSVKYRLSVGFGLILSLMMTLTVMGIGKVNYIDEALSDIVDVNSVKQRYAINYRGSVHDRAIAIRDVANSRTSSELSKYQDQIKHLEDFYRDSESKMAAMKSSMPEQFSEQENQILNKISEIQSSTLPLVEKVLTLKKDGNLQIINDIVLDEIGPAFTSWLVAINQFIDYQEANNRAATPKAREVAGGFQGLMLFMSLLAIAVSIIVGVFIQRSFYHSLGGEPNEVANTIREITTGNLSNNLGNAPAGSVLESIEVMQSTLKEIVKSIVEASVKLNDKTEIVSSGSGQALAAAEKQKNLTSRTASLLDSMKSSFDHMLETANLTEQNSESTVDFAEQGRDAVKSSAKEMTEISETVNNTVIQIRQLEEFTGQISGIANVINGISEQTNLLALNAAIEAARAGESGRGFAVVADEIRQLAQRTSEATGEIGEMITQIQEQTSVSVNAMLETQPKVENGKTLTIQASSLLENIEREAADSLSQIQMVTQAISQQVSGMSEIASSVEEIEIMSGNSIDSQAANKSATKDLEALSVKLKSDSNYFQL